MSENKTSVKYQFIAGVCVNIISLSYGAFVAWPSATFPVLQSKQSPLETGPMSGDDAGWVGSMLCLGGALGTVFFAWSAEKIGRRKSLMLIVVPAVLGWLIIPFAKNPVHFCISRFMGGFAGGGTFGVIPIYTTEIADNNMRGLLGTFLIFAVNIGVLLGFIAGYFFSYVTVAWLMLIPCGLYLCTFPCLPETPQHLIRKNKMQRAEKSFYYLRNVRSAIPELPEQLKTELEKLKSDESIDTAAGASESSLKLKDFLSPIACKALFIGLFLMILNIFCGVFAMLNYTATIFQIAKSNLSPNMSAIVVGAIQIVGSYFSTILVQNLQRKSLLIASCVGTAFGQISLGTYLYLGELGFDTKPYAWIPLASFSFTILLACVGILPLTLLMLSEVMPPKIRSVCCMFCMLCLWLFAFALIKFLPFLMDYVQLQGIVIMFGIFCLASVVFILVIIPETKGKSIEAIMAML